MNKQLKIVLKLSLCFLVTTLFNVSCTKDDDFTGKPSEEKNEGLVKRITLEELKQRIGNNTNNYSKLEKLFDVNKWKIEFINTQSRSLQERNPWLITNEISMIEKSGYATYTFKIGTQTQTPEFYNLVATINDDGNIISTRVIEYKPNASWFANTSQPFFGEIRVVNNDIFSSADILNAMTAQRFYQCIKDVKPLTICAYALEKGYAPNGHYEGHPNCSSKAWFDSGVTVITYGTCYEPDPIIYNNILFSPDDTALGGGGGGASIGLGSGTNTTNDCMPTIGNPCNLDQTVIMMPSEPVEPEETPCPNDPLVNIELAHQYGSSGWKGGMFGCTRFGREDCSTPRNQKHTGLDLLSPYGTPIYAMYDGVASKFTQRKNGNISGAGHYVSISSNVNGEEISILYFHMQESSRASGLVMAGDIIGFQGKSGNLKSAIQKGNTLSHLHIKVKDENGNPLDPRFFLGTEMDINGNVRQNDCN